jgi:hypothetical protein
MRDGGMPRRSSCIALAEACSGMRAEGGVWSDGQRQSAIRGEQRAEMLEKPKPSEGRDRKDGMIGCVAFCFQRLGR